MAEGARPGLMRVVHFEQASALMLVAGAVLSEGVLLALIGATHRWLESLLVGAVAVTVVCLLLLPLSFRIPARLRRKYEQAAWIDGVAATYAGQVATRRLWLWRTAGFTVAFACWMLIIGLRAP
jgi:hypothetical protein